MVLVHSYIIAVIFFVICMTCWGSWPNTQKLVAKTWRSELFYIDFITGLLLTAIIGAFTVGSLGSEGRTFLQDLSQADSSSIIYSLLGGIVWNLGNLLLVAAIATAGMSVGFPIGGGIAWILGIMFNLILELIAKKPQSNVGMLFIGVAFIIAAIYLSARSYGRLAKEQKKTPAKGILLSVGAGLAIAFFYALVVKSMDPVLVAGGSGTLTPFSGAFFFAAGAFISTPVFNIVNWRYPVEGERVRVREYFKGSAYTHIIGMFGGVIWMSGMILSFMAVGAAGPAISYSLSNAAPVAAILWGVFIWKEFKGAPKGTNTLLSAMFIFFLIGLVIITLSKTL